MGPASKQEGTIGDFADRVVYKQHPDEKERPMPTERTVPVSRLTLRTTIAGISSLLDDPVTALGTPRGYNGAKRTDDRHKGMLSALVKEKLDKIIKFHRI